MTEHEEVFRGENAKRLLNDKLFKEALETVRKEILQKWEETPARDSDAREWLWKLHQASLRFEGIFKGYIDSGKIASDSLRHKESLGKRILNTVR
jgi:hypothetical protein